MRILKLKYGIILAYIFGFYLAYGHNGNIPVKGNRLVYDQADMLSQYEEDELEQKLRDYNDSTSTQIVIVLANHVHGEVIQVATEIIHEWGVGQEADDNGLVILVDKENRRMAIATGYGVEEYVTDAHAKRIIENILKPYFRNGYYFRGLDRATSAIQDLMSGTFKAREIESGREGDGIPIGFIILTFLIFLLLMRRAMRKSRRKQYEYYRRGRRVYNQDWGRGGGITWPDFNTGGGVFRVPSGGGTWPAGGGSAGGGFRGFGGGSSGGGGASGSW